jgi:hypothetical protein
MVCQEIPCGGGPETKNVCMSMSVGINNGSSGKDRVTRHNICRAATVMNRGVNGAKQRTLKCCYEVRSLSLITEYVFPLVRKFNLFFM